MACAALLQRSVFDWHKHMYWYLEKGYSFEGHLDEICYVRKICGNLFLQSTKQKRRPLSAKFGKEWRHGETESRHNFVTALKVNAEWLGNALVRCTPGGGTQVQRAGGSHLRYVFRGRRGLFLRPPHVRDFVKEGYFFVPRYEVWGSKSPYNPQNIRGSDAEWLPKWLGFRVCCR